jgi:hypothetical protein
MGIPLENTTLYTLQFADDQVVLAGDKEDLEYMTCKLKEIYEKWGLDKNLNKTKYLCTGKRHINLKLDKNSEIESCQEYKKVNIYLPSLMMKVPNYLYVLGDTYTCHT